MDSLYKEQLKRLKECHFLVLYWAADAEVKGVRYNITNAFDDLKELGITRTKQSVMAYVESLYMLCFIEVRDERNRKNVYLSESGAQALEDLVKSGNFKIKRSRFLEGMK
ncbi:MAG: hypothetical protein MUC65_09060 [Pontiellaceae bacterium]|jgi:hypothetical protein|nr:hypothetical protein [Pontiellaceae bacterium]